MKDEKIDIVGDVPSPLGSNSSKLRNQALGPSADPILKDAVNLLSVEEPFRFDALKMLSAISLMPGVEWAGFRDGKPCANVLGHDTRADSLPGLLLKIAEYLAQRMRSDLG